MSATLLTSMDVRKAGKKEWLFLAPMVILVVINGVSYLIRVPPGFVTDYASVPRLPVVFLVLGGIGEYAAGAHDWLYTAGEYPREICDLIFREILIHVDAVPQWKADLMYKGVRIGGESHYTSAAAL